MKDLIYRSTEKTHEIKTKLWDKRKLSSLALSNLLSIILEESSQKMKMTSFNASEKSLKDGGLQGILGYSTDPLVSSDIVHDPRSSIFVPDWTIVLGDKGKFVKIMSWYDNEWGYSSRTADLVVMLGKLL